MKNALIAVAAAGLALVAASDANVKAAPAAYNWSGFYIGAHGGGGWADVDVTPGSLSPPGTAGSSFDASGGMFGALAGYNVQHGRFVYGLEGDVAFGSIDGKNESLTVPDIDIDLMASIRARAGLTFDDKVLVFVTAGWGIANADSTEDHGTGARGSSETHSGAVVGLGVEIALDEDFALRAEYQHGFFDEQRHQFPDSAPHSHGIEFDTDVVRAALVWSLN